jgi:hypothetical protein
MTWIVPVLLLAAIVLGPIYGVDSRIDERGRRRWPWD